MFFTIHIYCNFTCCIRVNTNSYISSILSDNNISSCFIDNKPDFLSYIIIELITASKVNSSIINTRTKTSQINNNLTINNTSNKRLTINSNNNSTISIIFNTNISSHIRRINNINNSYIHNRSNP